MPQRSTPMRVLDPDNQAPHQKILWTAFRGEVTDIEGFCPVRFMKKGKLFRTVRELKFLPGLGQLA